MRDGRFHSSALFWTPANIIRYAAPSGKRRRYA
jgi:hypothetical protein